MKSRMVPFTVLFIIVLMFSCDDEKKSTGTCGNDVLDPGEACDTTRFTAQTCQELGYYEQNGALGCRADCTIDVSVCALSCGDGLISMNHGEACDGADLGEESCASLGMGSGELTCSPECRFDTSGCGIQAVCGDGVVSGAETCDGADLGGESCETQGFYGGILACDGDCQIDVSFCSDFCGDGVLQTNYEACDGTEFNGATCEVMGYYEGEMSCDENCQLDMTGCVGICGDGILHDLEECDGEELRGVTCESLGFSAGMLTCDGTCQLFTAVCNGTCGDGLIQGYEACDGTNLGYHNCRDVGLFFNTPGCDAQCVLQAGTCDDVHIWGGDGTDFGYAVATDGLRNVFVTGFIHGANTDGGQVLLTKYDTNGAFIAQDTWNTGGASYGRGVATDDAGNVYVTGPACLVRYDGSLVRQWERSCAATPGAWGTGVAVDGSGNVYVTGTTTIALDGQPASGGYDIFLIRYDAAGVVQWTRQWGTSGSDEAAGVAVDVTGNVYVTGTTYGDLDGQTSLGSADVFLTRFAADGTRQWTRQWGSATADQGTGVAVDAAGNANVTGFTYGALNGQTSQGGWDAFLLQVSAAGTLQWTRQWGSAAEDKAFGVAVDPIGNIHVAGYTGGALDGQAFQGCNDIFLSRFDGAGARQWTRLWGDGDCENAYGLAVDSLGNAYLTGQTGGGINGQLHQAGPNVFLIFSPNTYTP